MTAPRCLVTGATGFIGRHLVPELCRRGYQVRCLVRPTSDLSPFTGLSVELAYGDLTNPEGLESAVGGVDTVFHLAGLIRTRGQGEYERVNAEGTRRLLEACSDANEKLGRFLLVSSVAAAGPSRTGAPVTEEDTPAPTSEYGRTKLAGELAARRYVECFPITIVRPPVVYGPTDRATLPLFRLANLGLIPALARLMSTVHVSDLVEGILLAAERPCAAGKTYFMSGAETATVSELLRMISTTLGRRTLSLPVPYRASWSAACLMEGFAALSHRPVVFDRGKAYDIHHGAWCCDSSLAQRELGFVPRTGLAEGLRDTALWYRSQGWLSLRSGLWR